jgi:hypothetical protein
MKDNRHKQYTSKISSKHSSTDYHKLPVEKHLLPVAPILLNLVIIIALAVTWYYILTDNLIPDYQGYVYWFINGTISYNILLGSGRSFVMPILTLIAGVAIFFEMRHGNLDILSNIEAWQILGLAGVGLVLSCIFRL